MNQILAKVEIVKITSWFDSVWSRPYIKIETNTRMKNAYIETLSKFSNLEEVVKDELIKLIENNQDIVNEAVRRFNSVAHNLPSSSINRLEYSASGKSINVLYTYGENNEDYKDVIKRLKAF